MRKNPPMKKNMLKKTGHPARAINGKRTFTDENTRREIRQLTAFEHGARLSYFRMPCHLPDGRILATVYTAKGRMLIAIDPASGEVEQLPHDFYLLKFREHDGRGWFLSFPQAVRRPGKRFRRGPGQLWQIDLPRGRRELLGALPENLPAGIEEIDITCDGRHLILCQRKQDLKKYPIPTTKDVKSLNHYLRRPRRGAIWTYAPATGALKKILETSGLCPSHLDASPSDPTLLRYCQDMPESCGQRIWTVRIDGRERCPIRRQQYGEMITHEFWWANPDFIGYTYQDRRKDPTLKTHHHWAEYSLAHTRLGIADLAGREVYLSDPLNSYHTHLYCSPDGCLVSGEGTESNSFIYAAPFSRRSTRIPLRALATIHTPYVPFRGQGVDCRFSADGQWLVYGDRRDGADQPPQLFAVKVNL